MDHNQHQIMRNYLDYYKSEHFYDDLIDEFDVTLLKNINLEDSLLTVLIIFLLI
jgi:hypothetical protein